MEKDINDDILLVGEANFSFTLSFLKYCNPVYITTSCYEDKETAHKKYGYECVSKNLIELSNHLSDSQVLFGIDATKLIEYFHHKRFAKIIFMFPHIAGKNNLRKNRELIHNFMISSHKVLKSNSQGLAFSSAIYIILANGQGGTSFEQDAKKRNNKDSWTINEIAQKCGLILTECIPLSEEKFQSYVSTGFRNQNKSFRTKAGLVHKFQKSLPLETACFDKKNEIQIWFYEFLKQCNYFINNDIDSQINLDFYHPLIEVKYLIGRFFFNETNLNPNFINDRIEYLIEDKETEFKLNENTLKLINSEFGLNLESQKSFFLRTSIINSFEKLDKKKLSNCNLNIFSGLSLAELEFGADVMNKKIKLNNYKYEIIFHVSSNLHFKNFIDFIIKYLEIYGKISKNNLNNEKYILYYSENNYKLCEINNSNNTCVLDASSYILQIFKLQDERILYTDDKRNFLFNNLNTETNSRPPFLLNFKWKIVQFSLENSKWIHDISFWHEKNQFSLHRFLETIRDACSNLVKDITLIDVYTDNKDHTRYSRCYRLTYESCDRCLSHNCTTILQNKLRDKLVLKNKFYLR